MLRRSIVKRVVYLAGFLPCWGILLFGQTGGTDESSPGATVEGSVRDSVSGVPLRGGRVVAALQGANGTAKYTAPIEANGTFQLFGLPDGRYSIVAYCPGYALGHVVVRGAQEEFTRVRRGAGAIKLSLVAEPFGSLTGGVFGDLGLPVRNATVRATKVKFDQPGVLSSDGRTSETRTNDLGEYRLFDLLPGRYLVQVQYVDPLGDEKLIDASAPYVRSQEPASYLPVFYPAASSSAGATLVAVEPGRTTSGINVILERQRTFRVSGEVTAGAGGGRPERTQIMLVPLESNPDGMQIAVHRVSVDLRTTGGRFTLSGVTSGLYELYAQSLDEELPLFDRQLLTVPNADVSGVEVRMSRGGEVLIRYTEWSASGQAKPADAFRLKLDPVGTSKAGRIPSPDLMRPDDDQGDHASISAFQNVCPGKYRLTGSGPEGAYIREMRVADRDVLGQDFEVAGAELEVTITIARDGGSISGRIRRPSQGAAGSEPVTVCALPADNRNVEHPHARFSQALDDGSFALGGLAPGKYLVFAAEGDTLDRYFADDVWPVVLQKAQQLTVGSRQDRSVELVPVPLP